MKVNYKLILKTLNLQLEKRRNVMIIKENMQINVSGDSLTTNNEIFDDLVSESEAVQLLKVSQMTLLRWRNAGILGFYRPGGHRVMYSKSKHLLPFLKSCEQSTKAA